MQRLQIDRANLSIHFLYISIQSQSKHITLFLHFLHYATLCDRKASLPTKSYVARTNFEPVQNILCNFVQICVKYRNIKYTNLTKNKSVLKNNSASEDEPQYRKAIFELPALEV